MRVKLDKIISSDFIFVVEKVKPYLTINDVDRIGSLSVNYFMIMSSHNEVLARVFFSKNNVKTKKNKVYVPNSSCIKIRMSSKGTKGSMKLSRCIYDFKRKKKVEIYTNYSKELVLLNYIVKNNPDDFKYKLEPNREELIVIFKEV